MARLAAWPVRRRVVAVALLPFLAAAFASVGPGREVAWATPVALLDGGLAALVLAGYLPARGAGRRLDLGCTPCSAVAAAAVLGALVLRSSSPGEPGIAAVASLLLAFGLAQRLGGTAGSCSVG